MNQILISKYNNKSNNIHSGQNYNIENYTLNVKKRSFIALFIFSILVLISAFIYMGYAIYIDYTKSNMYMNSYSDYDISKLYNTGNISNSGAILPEENVFSILGIIKIDKIKISYPILSKIDDELLKISPCRFSGPSVNSIR